MRAFCTTHLSFSFSPPLKKNENAPKTNRKKEKERREERGERREERGGSRPFWRHHSRQSICPKQSVACVGLTMSGADAAYSFSLTTFSRTGKLLQIEYALNAVQQGKTSLGIKGVHASTDLQLSRSHFALHRFPAPASNGVVIVTEKKLPTVLIDETEVSKIALVTPTTGFVYSGLGPDYRVLVRKSRKKAQGYFNMYRCVQTPLNPKLSARF
jgi:hypothetical protein